MTPEGAARAGAGAGPAGGERAGRGDALRRARLGLPAGRRGGRCAGPRTCGRCTSTTACAGGRLMRTSATARRLFCAKLGVWLEARVRVGEEERGAGNLQAWARERRYEVARRLAAGLDAPVAAGHTASAIRSRRSSTAWRPRPAGARCWAMSAREQWLVRPLPQITRDQTAEYCQARGLGWREDASNDDIKYARVRVRKLLVPALRAVHPTAQENVRRTAELRLRQESELLDGLIDAELDGAQMRSRDRAPGWSCTRRWRGGSSCAWRRTRRVSWCHRQGRGWGRYSRWARAGVRRRCTSAATSARGSPTASCTWSSCPAAASPEDPPRLPGAGIGAPPDARCTAAQRAEQGSPDEPRVHSRW